MYALNKVELLGNVGQDPKIGTTQSGKTYCMFSVATIEIWKKDGNETKNTEWHNCVAWGKVAEIFEQYVHKGTKIYIVGKLKTDKVEKDGTTTYYTKVVVEDFIILTKKEGDGSSNQSVSRDDVIMPSDDDSNIPF